MDLIKQLREQTNCGIGDCKTALTEANGDLEQAAEILRKKGIIKAAKRADREAGEGIILAGVNESATEGYILEINSETDFVARNEKFQSFANKIFTVIKKQKPSSLDELLDSQMNEMASIKTDNGSVDDGTVKSSLEIFSGTIGEKLAIKRMEILNNPSGTVASYIHAGGLIGVLVSLDTPNKQDLAIDIAMQVAAANPKYLDVNEAQAKGAEEIVKEKEIYREQLKNENKPEAMWEKIMEGKLQKYFQDVCLVEQEYIKDDKKKVKEILGEVKVEKFVRYSL
jgi:elongation factor Ts